MTNNETPGSEEQSNSDIGGPPLESTDEPVNRSAGTSTTEPDSTSLSADERYCTSCGTPIKREAAICPECGVRQREDSRTSAGSPSEPSGRYIASFIGGVVSLFVGFFLPFLGQIAGGAVAGYLRGSDTTEGAVVGSLSGFLASIPAALVFFLLLALGLVGSVAGGDAAGGFAVVVVFGGVLALIVGGYVVLGAIGGLVGAAITDRPAP